MSLGWKRFSFFDKEERPEHDVPHNSTCSASGNDLLILGCDDGQVITLDRGFSKQSGFQAFHHKVQHMVWLEGYKLLVTLGCDDASLASTSIKVWNLEGGSRTALSPPCIRTLKVFPTKGTEAEVTTLAVYEEGWPRIAFAAGLITGQVLVLHGDIGRDKFQRTQHSMKADGKPSQITGLAFRKEEEELYLFSVTPSETGVFNVKSGNKRVLDELGAECDCSLLNEAGELVVARPEAVYFYTPDGRGPCFVFQGEKHHLASLRHYLVAVSSSRNAHSDEQAIAAPPVLHCYDMVNKLIAATITLTQEPRHVVCAWGVIVVIDSGNGVMCLKEKDLAFKLELLFNKSLYMVALNLATSGKAQPAVLADIQRRYGDHLYVKHDYDGAMGQYIATIGNLEPSYVIRRFLDAQRIHNLTLYLEALHAAGKASADHTTLLLNCYTKLKDVDKLDKFLRGAEGENLPFDTETAVKVCRAAGYSEHALFVAAAAKEPGWYLDILLEDCQAYDEALAYVQTLPPDQATSALQKYGKVLVTQRPEATTALLMQLCTRPMPGAEEGFYSTQVADVAHLYADRPQALILLCEFILNSSRTAPREQALYHTLLQLYLSESSGDDTADQPLGPTTVNAARREHALHLLKRGWPAGEEPLLDPDHVLVLCRLHNFREGLIFIYESMRLYREVLQVHMAEEDHAGLIEACIRLGDASRGGDPHLWTEVLEYFGAQQSDCTAQVREVLSYIEAGNLLPPLVVLQTLAKNPKLKLSVVKGYIARQLASENSRIEEDRKAIAKYQTETAAMRSEISDIKTKARVFQNSKCALSGGPLELPAVHFLCGHSFNVRSLGENERECPLCAPQFRTILDIRRSIRASAGEQDKFFTQLKSTPDAFNVIAEYFGRGILNAR